MTPTYPGSDDPRTTMRRHDRATDEDWIRTMITRAPVGVLATVHEGQPFLTPNLFVYDADAHAIILHTGRKGRMRANVEQDGRASFSVLEMGRLLPADTALEFSVEYASVIAFGVVTLVTDPEAAARDLQRLLDKYAPHLHPGDDYRPPVAHEVARTSVFRLAIDTWSGKRKTVAEDFPGAYWYDDTPMLDSLRGRAR